MHCKLALFRVPYALRATFIPSLRFGTGYASPYNPCHCLKLKNSKLNLNNKFATQTLSKIKPRHFSGFILHFLLIVHACS
ncbi:MAG: hypothetical protein MR739_03980 [Spirochaetia bacterium]|nr:hypothetical protein [Spirochaetia bacterium]